jgi:hypothetical protein
MTFESTGAVIKSQDGNGPYCFRIHSQMYSLIWQIYPNEANKPGYRYIYIFDSAEATTK